MPNFPRIAVINTGWSDDYRGAAVRGNFGYLAKGVGHEKFNFLPDRRRRFYAYTPPLGGQHSPLMPTEADDWLVLAVSRRPGRSGLYLVGWYEGAAFARGYVERPDAAALGEDSDGGRFTYRRDGSFVVNASALGSDVEASTYLATAQDARLIPFDWYLAAVIAGALHHEMSDSHVAGCRAPGSSKIPKRIEKPGSLRSKRCLIMASTIFECCLGPD